MELFRKQGEIKVSDQSGTMTSQFKQKSSQTKLLNWGTSQRKQDFLSCLDAVVLPMEL